MAIKPDVLIKILEMLATGAEVGDKFLKLLHQDVNMPNIPTKTMGGKVWWHTIAEFKGWKIQQNYITHHARILNDKDVRVAWGTLNGMKEALKRVEEG